MIAALATAALAGSPQGTWTTEASLALGFRPGLAAQVDYGVWKGFWVGGRLSSQQEAYWAAGNLGTFTEKGTWHHGQFVGGGLRGMFGRNDRWDIEVGLFFGQELSFVRETVVYENSGQKPPYEVRDQRFYHSWQAGMTLVPLPTFRYRFAKNHGIVFQPWYSLSDPLAIERTYVSIGWTARWGGERVGSGG